MEIARLIERIQQKIAEVESLYQRQSGGASFCQVQRDGRVTGGLKYEEGRMVALHFARRALQQRGEAGLADIEEEEQTWLKALADLQAKPSLPMLWLAYRQGGVDAFHWLREQFGE
ncbi:hypothetical protein [Anaerolinea thermophila]|nr:hypothetical protein [Anaerolinea thermophila]